MNSSEVRAHHPKRMHSVLQSSAPPPPPPFFVINFKLTHFMTYYYYCNVFKDALLAHYSVVLVSHA